MKILKKILVLILAFLMVTQLSLTNSLRANDERIAIDPIIVDDIESIKILLNDYKLNKKARSEALIYAVAMGNREMIDLLLAYKVDINHRAYDEDIPTALAYAVFLGQVDIVKTLIKAKADVNVKSDGNVTPLLFAGSYGNMFGDNKTAYLAMVEALLEAKADPNLADDDEITPLMLATMAENKEVIVALLVAGAEVNAKTSKDITACSCAIELDNKEIIQILKRFGAKCSKKYRENTSQNKLSKIQATNELMALAKEARVYYDYPQRIYDLSNINKLKQLLIAGADINIQDNEGYTPLMRILEEEDFDFTLAKMLIKQGSNLNLKNKEGQTALHIFASHTWTFSPYLLENFIKSGANINAKDKNGLTPLMYIIKKFEAAPKCIYLPSIYLGNKAIEILLDYGANPNDKDEDGNTALSYLVQHDNNGHTRLVKTLLKFNADPFIKNNDKKDTIDYISSSTDAYIIKFLSEKTGLKLPIKELEEND